MNAFRRLDELAALEGRDLHAELLWWADQCEDISVVDPSRDWLAVAASFQIIADHIRRERRAAELVTMDYPKFADPPTRKQFQRRSIWDAFIGFLKAAGGA